MGGHGTAEATGYAARQPMTEARAAALETVLVAAKADKEARKQHAGKK